MWIIFNVDVAGMFALVRVDGGGGNNGTWYRGTTDDEPLLVGTADVDGCRIYCWRGKREGKYEDCCCWGRVFWDWLLWTLVGWPEVRLGRTRNL